jgi:hypothetical protein
VNIIHEIDRLRERRVDEHVKLMERRFKRIDELVKAKERAYERRRIHERRANYDLPGLP